MEAMRAARSRYAPLSTVANSPTMPVDLRRTDHSNKRKVDLSPISSGPAPVTSGAAFVHRR
jgi:hypothetical protein